MDRTLLLINAGACVLVAVALSWAIVSPKVHDGVVIKCGLISMVVGFFGVAAALVDPAAELFASRIARAMLLVNLGTAVVVIGYGMRHHREAHSLRRAADWADLEGSR